MVPAPRAALSALVLSSAVLEDGQNRTCLDERPQPTRTAADDHHCSFPIDSVTNKSS